MSKNVKPEQKAVIVKKTWCHDFKIGTKVTVQESTVNPGVYIATDANGTVDYVKPHEIEPA